MGLTRAGVLPAGKDVAAMLAQPRQAYVVYGLEPGLDFADAPAARKALVGAQVVAFSHFACASTRDVADVILPIGALPEIDATLTNLDGREQSARAGGRAREGWRVLRALGATWRWPVSTSPTWPDCVPAWPLCRSVLPLRHSRRLPVKA